MTPILLGVLFAAVQPELGSLRPQPLPPVRIIDPGGSISDLRDRVAGKAAELRFTATVISIRFHPDKVWREWQTDAKGIAAVERDLGGASASYFVNRAWPLLVRHGSSQKKPLRYSSSKRESTSATPSSVHERSRARNSTPHVHGASA